MKTSRRKHVTNINKRKRLNTILDLVLFIVICGVFSVVIVSQL